MNLNTTLKRLLAGAGTCVLMVGVAFSADPKAKDGSAAKAKGGKQAAAAEKPAEEPDPTGGLQAFCKMLPVGQKNAGVKIPSFTDGVPTSLITSRTMTRVDDENMALEGMDIRLFDQKEGPSKDLRVRLRKGLYHMPTQLLKSDSRSHIERSDFTMDGDSLIFDTRTQQGKMSGNVRAIIHEASALTGSKDGTSQEKKESQSDANKSEDDKSDGSKEKTRTEGVATPGIKEQK